MEFVWGLHDFTPEHDDEIEFRAGDRILVVEKDEQYEDGWWRGTNGAGKTGLFPQAYTTSEPPQGAREPVLLAPGPAQPGVGSQLQSLPEETDSLSGVHVDIPHPSATHGTVLHATMTDIQEAIEQLGVNQDVDDTSRSFSFTSTKDGVTTDDGEEADIDGHDDTEDLGSAGGENWHKDARTLLARNASRQNHRNAIQPLVHKPPIEVEMSDESEDEGDLVHSINRTVSPLQALVSQPVNGAVSHAPAPIQVPTGEVESPEPTPAPTISVLATPNGNVKKGAHIRQDSEHTIAQPTPQRPVDTLNTILSTSTSPTPKGPIEPEENRGPTPSIPPTASEAERSPTPAASPVPESPAMNLIPSVVPTPSVPPSEAPIPKIVSPPFAPQNLSVNVQASAPPVEWSIEQVVAWLRTKNFDDNVCNKFIEHEITGDVLLELDINLLKELDIMAFGKRMRIANAISDLRRPPSALSSATSARFPNISSFGRQGDGAASAPQSVRSPSNLYSPESAPGTGDFAGTPSVDRFPQYSSNGVVDALDLMPADGKTVGLGIARGTVPEPRNGRTRPSSLALSPSDSALSSRALWLGHSKQASGSSSAIPNIEEERASLKDRNAITDSEASTSKTKSAKVKKGFGRSAGSTSSQFSINDIRGSKDGTLTPSTSIPPSPSGTKSKASSSFEPSHKPKKSVDVVKSSENRHSFFGGTLGKSRKPAPRYSEGVHDTSSQGTTSDRPSRSLSRLYLSGSTKRPRTSHGSTPPSSTIDPSTRKRTLSTVSDMPPETAGVSPATLLSPDDPPELKPDTSVLGQIGEPDHEGWMRKKGERYNTWKLRYFVLKGPHLYYLRSKAETKIKGYINIKGYRIIADENANPGRYGFRILHDTGETHFFSSEEQLTIREWMKALMKATIGRDYTRAVISSVNIPTIPLSVAQAMSPAPRPPSPTARDATQRALRRENTNQLSSRDARVLMGLPSEAGNAAPAETNPDNSTVGGSTEVPPTPTVNSIAPGRPNRESRRATDTAEQNATSESDKELINWVNGHIPNASAKATDLSASLSTGLVLYRLAESIKGNASGAPEVPDAAFPISATDEKLDGLFILFDFLLDNDVRMGNVSINDVRQGNREKLMQLVKALKSWEEKRQSLERSIAKQAAVSGPFIGVS